MIIAAIHTRAFSVAAAVELGSPGDLSVVEVFYCIVFYNVQM